MLFFKDVNFVMIRLHQMHEMQAIAANGVVLVCLGEQKRLNALRSCLWCRLLGPREHCVRQGSRSPPVARGKGKCI